MNLVCDSSTLIALAETGTLDALAFLKEKTQARFFITEAVEYETMTHPEQIQRFAFSAFKIEKSLRQNVLEKIDSKRLAAITRIILQNANNVFSVNKQTLKVLQQGEAEALAAYEPLSAKGILVDEKTTRLFIEDAGVLKASLEQEYRGTVNVNPNALNQLKKIVSNMTVVRSSEILSIAYEKGFFNEYGPKATDAFHAALFALRNAGCSITTRELLEYQELNQSPNPLTRRVPKP